MYKNFSLCVKQSVQMMDVPILKTWLHSLVMEALASALVDPSSLDINLSSAGAPRPPTRDSGDISEAQGVLTVTITIPPVQAGTHECDVFCYFQISYCRFRLVFSKYMCNFINTSEIIPLSKTIS